MSRVKARDMDNRDVTLAYRTAMFQRVKDPNVLLKKWLRRTGGAARPQTRGEALAELHQLAARYGGKVYTDETRVTG